MAVPEDTSARRLPFMGAWFNRSYWAINPQGQSTSWMKDYFSTLGDYQPDTGQVHMPPGDKKDIYDELASELGDDCVSDKQFYHIWTTEFSHVKIPPQHRLGNCETCDRIRKKIMATRDVVMRNKHKQERRDHMTFVKGERSI